MADHNRLLLWSSISCCLSVAVGSAYFAMQSVSFSKASVHTPPSTLAASARISAMGRLEPLHALIKLAAPSANPRSRIKRLYVAEGDVVKRGQVIAELDVIDERRSALRIAEQNLAIARRRLQVSKGESEAGRQKQRRLEGELAKAERDVQRYTTLYENGALSLSDLDAARLVRDNARQGLEEHHAVFARLGSNQGEAVLLQESVSEASINLAAAELSKANRELEQAMIRAPQNGTILKLLKHAGEDVDQQGLLLMGDTSSMVTVAEVYESDVKHIRTGQRVTISSKALQSPASGTVISIGNLVYKNDIIGDDPSADIDTRIVEVRIRMDPSMELAKLSRLQVNVDIHKSH